MKEKGFLGDKSKLEADIIIRKRKVAIHNAFIYGLENRLKKRSGG